MKAINMLKFDTLRHVARFNLPKQVHDMHVQTGRVRRH